MINKNTFEVLLAMFSKTDLNISAIARHTKLSVMGVSKIVRQLEKARIVNLARIGRSLVVRLNKTKDNLELFSLAEKYRFEKFIEKHHALKGFLSELKERAEGKTDFLLIFGSYASGEEGSESDLDILAVSSNREILKAVKKTAVMVNISIAPIIVNRADFIEQYNKNHRLYREIVDGKRVLIYGEYKFWEMMSALK